MIYLVLALAWAAWAALHSTLISRAFRARLAAWWPAADCHWRFLFSLVALLTLLPPVWLTWRADGPWLIVWPWPWLEAALNLAALGLGWAAMRAFGGPLVFFGLTDLIGRCEPPRPERPIQTGLLGWARHPLYGLGIVLLWTHDLNAAGLVTSAVLTAYLLVGTCLEERRLAQEWGPVWLEYRAQVSAFLPLKRLRRALAGFGGGGAESS